MLDARSFLEGSAKMNGPDHPSLRRLVGLWGLEVKANGAASLGGLSARDLEFFHSIFKDSFVARGPKSGPFRLSFIGTDIDAHLGWRVTNAELSDCFRMERPEQIRSALATAVELHRPLLIEIGLEQPLGPEQQQNAEILCLPFREPGPEERAVEHNWATVFGMLAIADLPVLPAEPRYRELAIKRFTVLSAIG